MSRFTRFVRKVFVWKILLSGKFMFFLTLILTQCDKTTGTNQTWRVFSLLFFKYTCNLMIFKWSCDLLRSWYHTALTVFTSAWFISSVTVYGVYLYMVYICVYGVYQVGRAGHWRWSSRDRSVYSRGSLPPTNTSTQLWKGVSCVLCSAQMWPVWSQSFSCIES